MRWLRTLLMLSAVCSMWATAAFAECVRFGPWGMKYEGLNFVFDGTVLELKDGSPRPVAVMQVHRVFKGQLPARIEVHHWAGMEHPDLDMGKRYVLGITRTNLSGPMAIPHRPFVEPEDDPTLVYATIGCAAVLRDTLQQDGTLDGFGRGWPPGR